MTQKLAIRDFIKYEGFINARLGYVFIINKVRTYVFVSTPKHTAEASPRMYFTFYLYLRNDSSVFSFGYTFFQWATDQDIANVVADVGVTDFQDVKFFENRANGQSKGFCVISLGSDQSLRMVMDRLPKKEIHGQHPVVTLPTKQVNK